MSAIVGVIKVIFLFLGFSDVETYLFTVRLDL